MLVQFHWQRRAEPQRTEFVEQAEIASREDHEAWQRRLDEKHAAEAEARFKAGWVPMVCTEDSEYFVKTAP